MKKGLRIAAWVVGVLVVLPCIGSFGAMWLAEVPIVLATGWISFLARVIPEVSVRPGPVVEAVLVLAALGVGLHHFMRWLWPQLRAQEQEPRPWPVRWSVSILSLLVLLFLATMATVGIGHHVGWLASGRAPLTESSWGFAFRESREAAELCSEALDLSKGGVADEQLTGRLLANPQTRDIAEKLAVLPLRKPDSEGTFLVIPRDPAILQANGLVRCGGKVPEYQRERFQAAALPRLLAGEELVGELGY
ncbi:MAG TPA: hypothetical protein VF815_32735 [Myxococcaceae bacterium]|jgi:hypothetical protein